MATKSKLAKAVESVEVAAERVDAAHRKLELARQRLALAHRARVEVEAAVAIRRASRAPAANS